MTDPQIAELAQVGIEEVAEDIYGPYITIDDLQERFTESWENTPEYDG